MVSISPIFYARLFRTKVLREPLRYLHVRFELLLTREYWRYQLDKIWVCQSSEKAPSLTLFSVPWLIDGSIPVSGILDECGVKAT